MKYFIPFVMACLPFQAFSLPNPASKVCGALGGESVILKSKDYGEFGFCRLKMADEQIYMIPEWQLYYDIIKLIKEKYNH